jgi:hypothetical protein
MDKKLTRMRRSGGDKASNILRYTINYLQSLNKVVAGNSTLESSSQPLLFTKADIKQAYCHCFVQMHPDLFLVGMPKISEVIT